MLKGGGKRKWIIRKKTEIELKKARVKCLLEERDKNKSCNIKWNFIEFLVLIFYFFIGLILLFSLPKKNEIGRDVIMFVAIPLAIIIISYIMNVLIKISQDRTSIKKELFELLMYLKIEGEISEEYDKELNEYLIKT